MASPKSIRRRLPPSCLRCVQGVYVYQRRKVQGPRERYKRYGVEHSRRQHNVHLVVRDRFELLVSHRAAHHRNQPTNPTLLTIVSACAIVASRAVCRSAAPMSAYKNPSSRRPPRRA